MTTVVVDQHCPVSPEVGQAYKSNIRKKKEGPTVSISGENKLQDSRVIRRKRKRYKSKHNQHVLI
jgi:hypothetical protein